MAGAPVKNSASRKALPVATSRHDGTTTGDFSTAFLGHRHAVPRRRDRDEEPFRIQHALVVPQHEVAPDQPAHAVRDDGEALEAELQLQLGDLQPWL